MARSAGERFAYPRRRRWVMALRKLNGIHFSPKLGVHAVEAFDPQQHFRRSAIAHCCGRAMELQWENLARKACTTKSALSSSDVLAVLMVRS
jgi:hypothetical protein